MDSRLSFRSDVYPWVAAIIRFSWCSHESGSDDTAVSSRLSTDEGAVVCLLRFPVQVAGLSLIVSNTAIKKTTTNLVAHKHTLQVVSNKTSACIVAGDLWCQLTLSDSLVSCWHPAHLKCWCTVSDVQREGGGYYITGCIGGGRVYNVSSPLPQRAVLVREDRRH